MSAAIPSAEAIRSKLAGLSKRQIRRLAELSGVRMAREFTLSAYWGGVAA